MDLISPSSGLIFWQLFGLIYIGFWIYALVDLVRSEFRHAHEKLMWLLIILFAPVIGTFLYLSMGRRSKSKRKFDPQFSKRN
ncbi:PLD nuclease N-terminal domain-containing protein [Algoriphagus sp. CAU 1675]|uniref:PLD nuclease N-terminal domain-containing protein n=1 Tax=Algoriphagus sp. CAU 1675 TaxID=3032597 RepID=UPI0023DB2951|nr:PLD nuclease N-terminal domain-containing protein [Algoriphagus sp. CAU 1675]MDF2156520.1 PLD nuclease N-terminal domain-containing protein [Algoriphagus sp. CAU 1675]